MVNLIAYVLIEMTSVLIYTWIPTRTGLYYKIETSTQMSTISQVSLTMIVDTVHLLI